MYSGHNRMAVFSQQQIAEAMMRLLSEEQYDDISVSDLCREAQVSRQTFYTLFESKDNVVIYKLSREYCYLPESAFHESSCSPDMDSMCRYYSHYIISHRSMLALLARNNIMHCLYDSQYRSFLECPSLLRNIPDNEKAYVADYYASVLTGLARTYAMRGCIESEEQLTRIIKNLFQGAYCC